MAGGNTKPSPSSSSSHPKSRWESGNNNRQLPFPPPPDNNLLPKPIPAPSPFPFPDNNNNNNQGYGFHMLDRRPIALADGTLRSYFALPPDYPPPPPPSFLAELNGQGFGLDRLFPDMPYMNQEYWNSLGQENLLKRKFVDQGELGRRDETDERMARQRQQLLQYGNTGHFGVAGTSSAYDREDEVRAAKYTRGEQVSGNKHNEVEPTALKKAFLHFAKMVNENATQKKNYLADGKQGHIKCLACTRSSKDFPDMHALIMHTYDPYSAESLLDHLGLHKTLCILMGWNCLIPPDNSKQYQLLSVDEAESNRGDLIIWPPHVIIHNTVTGKGRDGRIEGLGNRAMDIKLKDLGFSGGKSKSLYGREGHLGVTLVKFSGDQSGLKEAVRLAEFFEKDDHGRQSWAVVQNLVSTKDEENNPKVVKVDKNTGSKERVLYGYIGTVWDLDKVDFETRKKVVIESQRDKQIE